MNSYIVKLSIPANTIDEAHAWAYLVIRPWADLVIRPINDYLKPAYVIGVERADNNKGMKPND